MVLRAEIHQVIEEGEIKIDMKLCQCQRMQFAITTCQLQI